MARATCYEWTEKAFTFYGIESIAGGSLEDQAKRNQHQDYFHKTHAVPASP
jgi:hypothetical protein